MKRAVTHIILYLIFPCLAIGQTDTIISLLTCYPGSDIYELEGHSAIRVRTGNDQDYAISFGLFNFNEPNFVYRFVKGETDYMVGAIPFDYFLDSYEADNRRVEELPLNLSPQEKNILIDRLNTNLLPQNRVYRYNYVKDNCSTRPFELIISSLDDSVVLQPLSLEFTQTNPTFRHVMRHYHKNYPWYQFGIDLALGSGIDYPLSEKEYAFVPLLMHQMIAGAKRTSGDALSAQPNTIVDVAPDKAVEAPTPWYLSPPFVCWLIFTIILLVTIRDNIRQKISRWLDTIYFSILGLTGLILTFLIFISVHEATSPNWLYLWLNPLCLIPPIFIWLKKFNKVVLYYQIVNFAVITVTLIAWPLIPQNTNPAFLPLILADIIRSGSYIKIMYNKK